MKMLKFVVALVCLLLVTVGAGPLQSSLNEASIIVLEEGCVRQGGLCRLIDDCEPENLVQMRGVLCPRQQHLGVECCYI